MAAPTTRTQYDLVLVAYYRRVGADARELEPHHMTVAYLTDVEEPQWALKYATSVAQFQLMRQRFTVSGNVTDFPVADDDTGDRIWKHKCRLVVADKFNKVAQGLEAIEAQNICTRCNHITIKRGGGPPGRGLYLPNTVHQMQIMSVNGRVIEKEVPME